MSTQLTMRALRKADAHDVAHLLNALYRDEGSSPSTQTLTADDVSRMLQSKQPTIKAMVAEYENAVVACVIYYAGFDVQSMTSGVHVADMVVHSNARRQHIGRKLLAFLAHEIAASGGAWMSLTCLKENQVGNKFYRALGFSEVSVQFYAIGARAMQNLSAAQ